ncbi:outer membrane beta-barrel protein [Pontibacter korlensis]|uniref:Outer membrane protein beta-barrel domain-containing protein n=1 Tax=Pontibacter korlensis TaxID=400092 RepID=A0A0E3UWT3_9BACT|nr:outer membrane beta-barrel protein [Pontibacter korlensis]AKD03647.1 hypothetical protein PKOR_11550 [Pontibacter korlensis]
MKQLILCALATFLAFNANAQFDEEEKKHVVGLQIGNAFANGNFKHSDFEDAYPAFARDGLLLNGGYRYNLSRNWATGTSLTYRHNRYDLDEFTGESEEIVTSKSSAPWRSIFTMADVYYQILFQDVTAVYLKGSAGAAFNRSASWQVTTPYGNINMPSDKATAPALGWGGGINFHLQQLLINIEAGLLYTSPKLTVLDTKGQPFQHRQAMNSFNLSIGLHYSL